MSGTPPFRIPSVGVAMAPPTTFVSTAGTQHGLRAAPSFVHGLPFPTPFPFISGLGPMPSYPHPVIPGFLPVHPVNHSEILRLQNLQLNVAPRVLPATRANFVNTSISGNPGVGRQPSGQVPRLPNAPRNPPPGNVVRPPAARPKLFRPFDVDDNDEGNEAESASLVNPSNIAQKDEQEKKNGDDVDSVTNEDVTKRKRKSSTPKSKASVMCNICGKSLKSTAILKEHMYIHTGEKPYVCTICGTTFADRSTRAKHMRTHEDKGSSPNASFRCDICKKTFAQGGNVHRHKRDVHREVKGEHKD